MNRDARISFPIKSILITAGISILSLFLFLAVFSRVLMQLDHFERYYEIVCFIVWLFESILLGIASRKSIKPVLFVIMTGSMVSLVVIAVGLFSNGFILDPARVGLRLALYFGVSLLLSVLPHQRSTKTNHPFKRKKR